MKIEFTPVVGNRMMFSYNGPCKWGSRGVVFYLGRAMSVQNFLIKGVHTAGAETCYWLYTTEEIEKMESWVNSDSVDCYWIYEDLTS